MAINGKNLYLNGLVISGNDSLSTDLSGNGIVSVYAAQTCMMQDATTDEYRVIPFNTGFKGNDIIFMLNVETGGALTIKAGTGLQGTKDLTVTIESNEQYLLRLEDGKYLQTKNWVDGDINEDGVPHYAGTVEFQGDGTLSARITPFSIVNGEDPEAGGDSGGGGNSQQ